MLLLNLDGVTQGWWHLRSESANELMLLEFLKVVQKEKKNMEHFQSKNGYASEQWVNEHPYFKVL